MASMCEDTQGCVNQRCDSCQNQTDCEHNQACRNGLCTDCQSSSECGERQFCLEGLCLDQEIPSFNITVLPEDFRLIMTNPYERIRVPCRVHFQHNGHESSWGGQNGCRIRIHGGSSRDYSKRSFRITFDEETLDSEDHFPFWSPTLTLRAEYNDDSYLRNHLSYELFRRWTTLPTPRTRYVHLTINDEFRGLYVEVERIDQNFLNRWKRNQTQALVEADPPNALFALGIASLVPLPSYLDYTRGYDLKSGLSLAPLQAWIEDDLMEAYESQSLSPPLFNHLRSSLVWESYLKYLALMITLQNRDFIRKNYYFSLQKRLDIQQWEFYPWDLDLTWGCVYNDDEGNTLCDDLQTLLSPDFGMIPPGAGVSFPTDGFYNLLYHLAMNHPQIRPLLQEQICTLISSELWQEQVIKWVDGYQTYLWPLLVNDTRDRIESRRDFEDAIEGLKRFKDEHTPFISTYFQCSSENPN